MNGPSPSASFDGLDFTNWGGGHPPDTNGDVGPQDYIQTINTSLGIYRKSDGVRLAAFTFNTFMNGHFGNLCDTNNFGDPVVVYDTFEDRWIITDFAFILSGGNIVAPAFQCFAVSKSGDPVAGGWNFYSIQVTDAFPDYPKFGIWPDGLYMSANLFGFGAGGSFHNVRVWAFNKAQMYAGNPTVQVLSFDAPSAEFTILPGNARLQTGTPPAGSPNYFAVVWQFLNAVSVYKFHVNWNSISTSTFSGPFISITPTWWAQYSGTNGTVPSPANNLDSLYPRLMVQNQYSNISGVESLWTSHTVGAGNPTSNVTSGQAAVRYYQVKVTGGTVEANATQSFTFSPDATVFRFMPSVEVDRAGDMAIGYSASNGSLNPAIRYAGRLVGDPVNSITQTETSLIEGTGTQSGNCGSSSCTRWGDYSAMSLDPNGCTFWYTNMYYQTTGLAYNTRIGAFSFPSCTPSATGTLQGKVTASGSGNPIQGATVALGSRTATTDVSGNYSFTGLPSGTYPGMTASFPGYVSGSATNIVVNDGLTTTQNFSLTLAPTSGCLTDTTQADFQTGVPTNCDLTTSPGDVILVNAANIDQQNTTVTNSGFGFTSTSWAGQTFQAGVTGQLTRVDLDLFCSGCTGTTPNITVSIRATTGSPAVPTGADLATATITGFSSGAGGFFTANFSSPPTLTGGTTYAVILRPVSNPSAGIYAYVCSCASPDSNPYANGQRVTSGDSGSTWTADTTAGGRDLGFKTYMQTGFVSSGTFVSSVKDANPATGSTVHWNTLSWTASTPTNTAIKFQAAASNNTYGPFNFVGPDGTAGTFFTNGGSLAQFNGNRYLKYQASLSTTNNAVTPTLNDVTACFSVVSPVSPPTISKAFSAASIPLNGTATVTFTISNPNASTTLTGVGFSDTLPSTTGTLVISSTPNVSNTCGGTVTATAGTGVISLAGGTVNQSASCTLSVDVKGTAAGDANNTTGVITSTEGGTGTTSNTATLKVVAPPVISKAFGAAGIPQGATTPLTFTITNPAANTVGQTGVAFTDTLPAGLTVATNTATVCGGGTLTTTNPTSISLAGGSIAVNSQCVFSVTVTGAALGNYTNTTGNVSSTNGGTGNTASANLTVATPPTISKAFGAASIPLNGTTSLTLTITNPAANAIGLTGVGFTDNLPAGLVVATPDNLNNTCGGSVTAVSGFGLVRLTAGTLAANSSCTLSVNVTGTTAGVKSNTTGAVTSTESGPGATSNTATLTVIAPPTISKAFGAPRIPLNGTTSLTFTLTNPNGGTALTGIGFTDTLPNATGTLVVATPNNLSTTCTGTPTATQGSGVISLTGASLAAGASCTLSVNVTGTAAGNANNISGAVTSTEGGTGGTASATLIVVAPPSIAKAFGAASIPLNGSTSLTLTITNPAANTVALFGVAVTDSLPVGIVVATPNGLNSTCGGTTTANAGSGSVSLTGGVIAVNSNCTVTVNVTGTATGNFTNTTGAVSSTQGGTGNTASANLTVASPPSITKTFNPTQIALNANSTLTFTIQNPNTNVALSGVAFTDSLPAGLAVATPPNVTGFCGSGTITATAGSGSVSLSGGTLTASPGVGSSCTFSMNVTGTTAGVKNNSVTVTSTEGGTGNTSNASITVVAPPTISKAFGAASIPLNGTTTLTFTINNPNTSTNLTGVSFSDTLPSTTGTLVVANPPSVSNTCAGTVTATAGTNVITLSGGTVNQSASCTLTVNVQGTAAGDANNTTGAITSTEGGTGTTSNTTTLKIVAPPTISKAFGASSIPLNGTTTVTFTITNPGANTTAETGVAFSDTLTNGLQVAGTPGVSNNCGGTVTATAGTTSISLSGGSIATSTSCNIVVNVTGTQTGVVPNTTGAVSSTNGGTGAASNTANLIVAAPPTITKAFNPIQIALNTNSTLTFTITNPNTNLQLTGVGFSPADTFPAGLVVATPNNLNNTCGGTATATAGSGSVNLTGVTLAASASCTLSVNVTGTSAGVKSNSVTVTATESGTGSTGNANLTVVAPPTISKSFGAASVLLNASTSLSFTINNPNTTTSLTGISFADPLPAGLQVSSPNGLTGSCGGGTITAVAGSGSVGLSGATLAASASCTFSVNVTGITPGTQNNTTSAVTSNEGGTGLTASASILVVGTDVAVSLTHSPDPANIGGKLKFVAVVSNNGAQTANVTFSESFTGAQVLISANSTLGSCGVTEPVTCNLGSMTNGQSATVTIVVTPLLGRTVVGTATVTPDIPDSNPANNTASNTVRVRFKPFHF